jgi:hypothetical protein
VILLQLPNGKTHFTPFSRDLDAEDLLRQIARREGHNLQLAIDADGKQVIHGNISACLLAVLHEIPGTLYVVKQEEF